MRNCLLTCLVGMFLFSWATSQAAAADRHNVIVMLIDDMGWRDLGCQGSTAYDTPHIDRLAASGVRFTNAYSACTVCSPTRAALLTGKYPARLHITDWIAGHERPFAKLSVPDWTKHLPLEEVTLAEVFQQAGYATVHMGKWHLGGEGLTPLEQGFQVNLGGTHAGQPPSYFDPYKIATLPDRRPGEYLTDRITDEAVAFIAANKERPFFLSLPHFAVHTPLQAKPNLVEKYKAKLKPNDPQSNAVYAAMIASLDESVGRILDTLDDLKLAESTVVVFTSDNGGLTLSRITSNAPLRAGKGSAYEGGVRVPLLVRAPGLTKPKSTSDMPAMTIDLLPTLLDVCGLADKTPTGIDGVSLKRALVGDTVEREALYWHYPHYHPGGATPYGAIRAGDWRLIEFFEDNHVELYNLRQDLGESKDLAASEPAKAEELKAKLHAWRKSTGAQMPSPNPKYDPARNNARPKEPAKKGKA